MPMTKQQVADAIKQLLEDNGCVLQINTEFDGPRDREGSKVVRVEDEESARQMFKTQKGPSLLLSELTYVAAIPSRATRQLLDAWAKRQGFKIVDPHLTLLTSSTKIEHQDRPTCIQD